MAPPYAPVRFSAAEIWEKVDFLRATQPKLAEVLEMEFHSVDPDASVPPPPQQLSRPSFADGADLVGFPLGFVPCWRQMGVCSPKPKVGVIKKAFARQTVYSDIGLDNQYHYLYLCQFLSQNGGYQPIAVSGDGECLFSALRREFQVFAQYSNLMFRRQIAKFMLDNWEWLFPIVAPKLRAILGTGTGTPEDPGPFSYLDYAVFIANSGNWGDLVTLEIISYMMGVKITVVMIPHITEVRIRHNELLSRAHLVVLYNWSHYSAVGELTVDLTYLFHSVSSVSRCGSAILR